MGTETCILRANYANNMSTECSSVARASVTMILSKDKSALIFQMKYIY